MSRAPRRSGADAERLATAAKLFRGLGDGSRLRLLAALRDGPLPVGAIVSRTGLTQPNASMHLKCLAECGLVSRERQARFVYYELADKRVVRLLDAAEDLLLRVGDLIAACRRTPELVTPTSAAARGRRTRRA
jgi:DNA-binding transcriptional ArsR family regulator